MPAMAQAQVPTDALEAVVAAVYLDGGLSVAFQVIERQFSEAISELNTGVATEDFKSRLQELVQVRFKTIPDYTVVAESGPDHDKTFCVRLMVLGLITEGRGKSKKQAEQNAAKNALDILRNGRS